MSGELLADLLEEELTEKEPTNLELKDLQDVIKALRKARAMYSDEIHKAEVRLYEELASNLFHARLGKYLEGMNPKGFDSELYKVVSRLENLFKAVVTGAYAGSDKWKLFVVREPFILGKYSLEPGDLIVSDLNNVLNAVVGGYLDLVRLERVGGNEGA
ncbi:MAG: hypothetical protein ACP5HQ_06680 [Thermoprotei archaeon]